MHQPVQQRGDDHDVAEERGPILKWTIGGQHRGALLVATHEHVGQLLARLRGELPQEQIVDEEEIRRLDAYFGENDARFGESEQRAGEYERVGAKRRGMCAVYSRLGRLIASLRQRVIFRRESPFNSNL